VFGSDHAGERDAAARAIERVRLRTGMTWSEILNPAPARPRIITPWPAMAPILARGEVPDSLTAAAIGSLAGGNCGNRALAHRAEGGAVVVCEGAEWFCPRKGSPSMTNEEADDDIAYYFKDGKLHFTEEGLRHFTKDERNRLVDLHEQHAKKFDEICDHVAGKPGYGPKESLSDEQRSKIVEKVEELTELWDSEVEMSEDPEQAKKAIAPDPSLQTLLAEHHRLGEDIMDIRDAAVARDLGQDDEAA
jgi:hypothetical protein